MKKRIRKVYHNFLGIIRRPEMSILPGQIAFYFLMSLIPILALVALIASKITNSFDLINAIKSGVPEVFADIIINLIKDASSSFNFILLLAFYLIIGSNGPQSIIIAANTLYEIRQPNILKLKIKSIIMILIIILLLIFMIFVPIFGDLIIKLIIKFVNNPDILLKFKPIYSLFKLFFSFIIIYSCIKLLYTLAPDKKIRSKDTTVGSLFTAISWIISTEIFAFYIKNIANYNQLYGNFANILILLMWLYFLAYLFVIGMVLNANYDETSETKDGK